MASFRHRGNRWQARVRRQGHPDEVKSFVNRQDAERWARSVEIEIDRGSFISTAEAQKYTFADLIERYLVEVLRGHKHEKTHSFRFRAMARSSIGRINMAAFTAQVVARYRDERLQSVSAAAVIRELACISSVINIARKEWGISMTNPVQSIRKPTSPKGRERMASDAEMTRLLAVLEPVGKRNIWMKPLVLLAVETAMRRGELLSLKWNDIDLAQRTATLWETKNGETRVVPLSSQAIKILKDLPRCIDGRVFSINGCAVSKAWETVLERAQISDFHFHDLRHMAITQMAQKLPNIIELSAVSGHKSLAMLKRYYHPKAADLARKLG
jgi:integrase